MNISLIYQYPNYGLEIISACLKKKGHDTKIILMVKPAFFNTKMDLFFKNPHDEKSMDVMINLLKDSDLIGISLTTNLLQDAIQITKKIKKELKIPIIWGGIHPTIKPEECLEYADMVCRGEGEEAIVELVEKMEKGENYLDTKNICFKNKNGKITLNPLRPLLQDLDSIPFPDWDLKTQYLILEGKTYKMNEISNKVLSNKVLGANVYNTILEAKKYRTMFTRGCPFGCSYCCNNYFNKLYSGQNILRKRSVDNVIEELKKIKENLPFFELIIFEDDNFFYLSTEEIKEFSEKYKKEIGLQFALSGHPLTITREKLKYLADAGLIILKMGIQTCSEKTKKLYKRNYPNSQIENTCKIINEFRDKIKGVIYDIILDNPWETEEDLIKTLIFLNKLPTPYFLLIFSLVLFPGTELYDLAKKENLIKNELENIYQKHFMDYTKKYINSLFALLAIYAKTGRKIHTITIFLLTNKLLRKLRLSLILYWFFRIKIYILYILDRINKITWSQILKLSKLHPFTNL